jgi:hypothetical protein
MLSFGSDTPRGFPDRLEHQQAESAGLATYGGIPDLVIQIRTDHGPCQPAMLQPKLLTRDFLSHVFDGVAMQD